jgi:hypothetical protein
MTKDDLYIGKLCGGPHGTGVISWVDADARFIYMSDLPGQQYYKVNVEDLDSLEENRDINLSR